MRNTPKDIVAALVKKASMAAAAKLAVVYHENRVRVDQLRSIRRTLHGAKNRCRLVSSAAYKDYGGRGIRFLFVDAAKGAEWVLDNLGPRPLGKTLDRIDNEGHYEPGNLRWATPTEQNRNKRMYKSRVYGERMRRLQAQRPDYTYEGLRKFIKLGWSDVQILNNRKGSHARSGI